MNAISLWMSELGAALAAEVLKTKRTLALVLAFLAPVLVVFLEFLVFYDRGKEMAAPDGGELWTLLMTNSLMLWGLMMTPLFVTLQTALLGGLEHGGRESANNNWKHLFALPLSRGAIYAAKQLVAAGLIGLSTPVLWIAILLAGLVLRGLYPGIGFDAAPPVWTVLKFCLITYLASWLIIAIHTWIGVRWPNFLVAMGAGVAATIVAVIILQSRYNIYYPWTLPAALTRMAIIDGSLRTGVLAASILGGFVFSVIGGIEFSRRDVL